MSVAYFDSSALVKLLVDEEGREDVVALWRGASSLITSRIANPEVRAALAAAHRSGRISDTGLSGAKHRWDRYRASLRMVELTRDLELSAGEIAERYALAGSDAVHLAAALTLAGTDPVIATWDRRLLAASQEAGLATLPAHLGGG